MVVLEGGMGYAILVIIVTGLGMFLLGGMMYPSLPARVPSHWNIVGEVDAWQSPLQTVLGLPLLSIAIGVVILFLTRLDTRPMIQRAMAHSVIMLMCFFSIIHVSVVLSAVGYDVAVPRVVIAAVGLVFGGLSFIMRDVIPNDFIGIRVKWTLENSIVWHETHAIAAGMFGSAAVLLVVGAFTPLSTTMLFLCLCAAVVVAVGWPVLYAYRRYHQLMTDETSNATRDD